MESKESIAMSKNNVKISEESIQATNANNVKPKLKRGPRENPIHLRTAEMVNSAILALNERNGSSIQAIKKYMAEAYNIDTKKKALFIKKYLISAVDSGVLYRTRGSGAAGSFRVCKPQKLASKQQENIIAEPALPNKIVATKKSAIVKKSTAVPKLTKTEKDKEKKADAIKKAAAKKKQAAADKKLAAAMKKLAAVTKETTAVNAM